MLCPNCKCKDCDTWCFECHLCSDEDCEHGGLKECEYYTNENPSDKLKELFI